MATANIYQPLVGVVINYALWMIPILIGLAALKVLLVPRLKGMEGEALVARTLNKLFPHVLHDIIIPDGRDGLTQLDHVALTPAGLLVVETKNYKGMIFGKEREKQWTQRLGRQSFRFMNPLRQNHLHIKALQGMMPDVVVYGRVVFAGEAKFPKGMPAGVSRIANLKKDLADQLAGGQASADHLEAWEKLKAQAKTDKATRKAHLQGVREKKDGDLATPVALGMLVVSVVWLLVMWARS